MNEDTSFQPLPESDDHHLEARIVAMILGEASDFEREQLLQLIAERPDLAEFHAQMMQTHGLLGAIDPAELDASEEMTVFASLALSDVEEAENESTLKSDPAWQLSDEKRLALLAVLSESSSQAVGDDSRSSVVTGSSGGPWWSRLKGRHYLVAAVSAGLLLSVGAAVVPMGLLRSPVMTASYWEAEDSIEDSMVEGMEADGIATDSYIAGFESGETRSAVAQTRSANRGENWEKAQQTVASNSLERLRESFESVTPQPPQLTPSPSRTPSRMGDLTAAGSGAGVGRSINGQDLAAGGASGPGAQPNPELWDSLSMQRSADTALPGGGDGRASMRDLGSTLNRNSQSGGSVDPNSLAQNSRDYFRFGGAYNSDSGGTDLSLPQVETPSDYGLAGAPRGKSNQTNFGNRWAEEKAKSSDLSLAAEGRFDDRFNKVASNGLAADFDTDLDGTDARTKWGLQTPSTQPELPTLSYSIPADKQSAYPKGVAPGNPVPSFAQGNPTHFYSQPQQPALEPSSGLAAGGLPAPTESAGPEAPDGGQAILGGVFVPNGRTMLNSDINGQTQLEGMFGANTSGGGRGGRAGMGGGGFGGGGGGDYGRGDGGRGSAVAASRGRGIVDAETGVADAPVLDSLKDFSGVPSPQTPRPTVANELPPTNAPHMMEESRKLAESEPAGEITMDGEALAKRESRSRFEAMNGAKAPTRNFRRSQMGRDRSVEFDVAETAEAATRENLFDEAQAGRQQQGQGQAQAGQRALGLETMIADQDQLGTETFRYKEGKLQLGQGLAAKSEEKNVAGAEIQLTRPDVTLADDMVAELEVDELEALIVSPGTESAAALGDLAPQQKMAKAGEVLAVREAQQQISKSLAELSQLNQQIAQANDDFLQIAPQQTPAKKRTLEGESLARKDSLEEQEMEEALLDQEDDSKADEKKDASRMPIAGKPLAARPGLEETLTETEAFSTFSLHVSDVSFKVVQSLLQQQQWPTPDQVRIEEFVNALDYHDPLPSIDDKVACQIEQGVHPFLQQRNLMRVSMRTAATGRANGVPLRLTLLLDNSGSMDRMDRRETVVRAFDTLTQQLGPNDQITLIRFANRPHLVRDRLKGDEAAQLVPLVRDLPSEGGTNFETALELAYQKAQEQFAPAAQNRVILLTDGAVNLGDADPERLARKITDMRDVGIAFDAAGISARDLNDEVLESLTRKGDGRYYLLDSVESVSDGFSQQIAGALRPAAKNVKVQVEFNPQRVRRYKLLGFEKHRLNKEDFRNDKVDAAEMAAAEAGVAVYQFEALPDGIGDVGSVSVRFQDLSTGRMVERRWPIPYDPNAARIESANPELQMATVASLLAAKLKGDALGDSVELDQLGQFLSTLPPSYGESLRVQQLQQMIRDARNISNR